MQNILEKLYFGNLNPCEEIKMIINTNDNNKKIQELLKLSDELHDLIDEELLQKLYEYEEMQVEVAFSREQEAFTKGFRLGMKFTIDGLM